MVFVHVESPDEAGHQGDAAGKVEAIEKVDALMVPQVMEARAPGGPRRRDGGGVPEARLWCCPTIRPRWRSRPTWPSRCRS